MFLPISAQSVNAANSSAHVQLLSGTQLAQDCSQRVGPFATQTTAWQRWQQVRGLGYDVSNGVVPCYDADGARGYCFNIFVSC